MEHIAIISDIHGNLPALEAVVKDIEQRRISRIINLGDMAGFGPDGDAAITWCRQNCDVNLYGNWEEFFSIYRHHEKSAKYLPHISDDNLEYIKDLPLSHRMWISGKYLQLFHGRPVHPDTMWMESPTEKLQEMFTILEDETKPDIVGYGDLHRQYRYDFHGSSNILFNPGSVGAPFSGTEACYMILSGEIDSKTQAALSMEFVKLPYDIDKAVKNALAQKEWFDYEPYVKSITTGTWQAVN